MTEPDDAPFDAEKHWRTLLGDGPVARRILEDPGVDAAVRSGNPRKVHAALRKARFPPGGEETEAIARALRDRRAFVERAKPPSLYTLNGIGTRFGGRKDRDPQNGTFVGTVYFTFLWIPLFPLSSWLAQDAPQGGWIFFGRVPHSGAHRVWRIAAPLAALCIALAAYSSIRHKATHSTLRLLNALDVAVTTTVDGNAVALRAGGQRELGMRKGRFHLVTRTDGGEPVEELDVDVPGATDVVVYNVLGAAPVYLERVTYTVGGEETAPDFELLAGPSFFTRDDVPYAFRDPPKTLTMKGKREVRLHVGVAQGGWRVAVSGLLGARRFDAAARIATRIVVLQKSTDDYQLANTAAALVGSDRVVQLAKDVLARMPESIDAHRIYQTAMIGAGRGDAVRAEYKARYEREPGSATAGYLYARTLRLAEAAPLLESLRKDHPDDPWLLRAMAWTFSAQGRVAEALPFLERLATMPGQGDLLGLRARALVAAGRTPDAQRLVLAVPAAERASDVLVLYAKLRRLPDADRSLPTDALPPGMSTEDAQRARASLAAAARDAAGYVPLRTYLDDDDRTTAEMHLAAATDPADAARRAETAPPDVLGGLDVTAKLTIGCELVRTGKVDAAKRVFVDFPWAALGPLRFESLRDPLTAAEDDAMDDEWRAVLLVAASRRENDPNARDALLERARALDVLRCVVPP